MVSGWAARVVSDSDQEAPVVMHLAAGLVAILAPAALGRLRAVAEAVVPRAVEAARAVDEVVAEAVPAVVDWRAEAAGVVGAVARDARVPMA